MHCLHFWLLVGDILFNSGPRSLSSLNNRGGICSSIQFEREICAGLFMGESTSADLFPRLKGQITAR